MSYAMTGRRTRSRGRRARGLGDNILDWFGLDTAKQAIDEACPPSAATQGWMSRVDSLQSWNPPPFVTADEVRGIVGAVMGMVNVMHNAGLTVQATYNVTLPGGYTWTASNNAFTDIGKQAVNYTLAVNQAYQQAAAEGSAGGAYPIYAPGLKQWVIDASKAMVQGMRTVEIAICTKPGWVSYAQSFQGAFDTVWNATRSVVGVVVAVASKAVKAVEGAFDVFAWLGRNPLIGVAAGLTAFMIVKKYRR